MRELIVADLICLYRKEAKAERFHSEGRQKHLDLVFGLFAEKYGPFQISVLKPYHLKDFIAEQEQWKSQATRHLVAADIKAAFNWALIDGRIDRNPFHGVRYDRGEKRPAMADDSLDKICAVANHRYRCALRFLRLTWRRVSEMCAADWPDVDLERGVWVVRKPKGFRRTRKPQQCPLVPEAVELLKVMRADAVALHGKAEGAIFLGVKGRRLTRVAVHEAIRRAKKKLGLNEPASTHGIRHRGGTAAVLAGVPLKHVSAIMGHASVKTTEDYYVHLEGEVDTLRDSMLLASPKRP